ncbi:MAG TPA: hypothetical protein VMF69_02085 [Gemmataceae bacterium]|nr:hypothetical protein [Gemmataceae bacterium]
MFICAKCGQSLTSEQATCPCPECGSLDRAQCATDGAVATDQAIIKAKVAAAKELAKKHYEVEDGLMRIFRLTSQAELEASRSEPIKLLEVNENTVPSGVMPLHFGPVPAIGIPFPSIIVEVTPEEFTKIKTRELKLPKGWEIGEELPKTAESRGGA